MKTEKTSGPSAFTRTDLLVTIITLAILAVMLLPALARTRVKPQGMQCLNNLRQITLAWMIYANESNGVLTPNHGIFPANADYIDPRPNWVAGNMNYTGGGNSGTDDTNAALLVDPAHSELGPYVKDPALFRCPADLSQAYGLNGGARVRSYSMNCAVGSTANGTCYDSNGNHFAGHWLYTGFSEQCGHPFTLYLKDSDFTGSLSPAGLFLLADEHPDGINDACFQVQMPAGWPNPNPLTCNFIDYPAKYHNNAGNFSFADGHVESHLWQKPLAIPSVNYAPWPPESVAPPFDVADVGWVCTHTTTLASH